MGEPTRILPCPTCRKTARWSSANPYRPFCSERCRLIDLGGWASESHRIAGEPVMDDPAATDMGSAKSDTPR